LALSVLANNKRINAARCYARFGCQGASQTRGVEERAAADDLGTRQTRVLQGEVGEDVDWVSNQKKNCGRVERFHVFDHAGEDGLVAADEVGAGFACEVALVG
jgi:hypothetical protein